ncbi:serine protease grass-like isoform X2 [Malaya genurostris]|uniref:serine protease grass-like isoform X2 n=1 Tax=Malaya genurostris TaxID=325434 RepID=UPI0026F3AB9D|nr:serine protease grass-like isoform X2 [Malaya genurostris]
MASVNGSVICLLLVLFSFSHGERFHFPDKAQLELSDVLNKDCGSTEYEDRDRPAERRLQESPWLVLFYYPDESVHFCHGTLITRTHILTTAVCASNIAVNETSVVLGEYDLATDQDCEGVKCSDPVQRRSVEKVIIHDGYNQDTFLHDIAIIVIDREVLLSDSIKPICLPLIKFEIGTVNQPNVYNSLWTTMQRPQQYWMRYVELDDCRQLVGHKINLNEGQICARSYNNKTIEMTGGAGSALEVEYHSRMYQVAMLSIGILESEPGTPFIYVDIPKYVQWIHDTVKSN